jgi:hypothetical protein
MNSISHRQQFSNAFFEFYNSCSWHALSVYTAKQHLQMINYIQWKSNSSSTKNNNTPHSNIIFFPRSFLKVHHTENVIQKNNWYAYKVGLLTDA